MLHPSLVRSFECPILSDKSKHCPVKAGLCCAYSKTLDSAQGCLDKMSPVVSPVPSDILCYFLDEGRFTRNEPSIWGEEGSGTVGRPFNRDTHIFVIPYTAISGGFRIRVSRTPFQDLEHGHNVATCGYKRPPRRGFIVVDTTLREIVNQGHEGAFRYSCIQQAVYARNCF